MTFSCRSCLTKTNEKNYYSLLTIFSECGKKSILDLLNLVTSSKIIYSEDLPCEICVDCFQTLMNAYNFIVSFKSSQALLQNNTENFSKDDTNIYRSENQDYITLKEEVQQENLEHILDTNGANRIVIVNDDGSTYEDVVQEIFGDEQRECNKQNFEIQMKKTVNSEPSSKQKSQKFIMVSKDDILKLETSSNSKGMDMQKKEASFSYKKEENEVFVSEEDEVYLNKNEHDDISGDDNLTDQEQQENTEDNEDLIKDIFKMEKNQDRNVNNIQIVTIDDVLESENRKSISKKIVLTVDDVLAMKPRGKKSKSENEMQLFACEICNNVFTGRKKLKMHKIRIHNPDWETKYKCHICGLKCKTMSAHSHHLSKHANKRYNCDRCEKTYVSKSKVREHILRIHEKKMDNKYLCPECGKGFKFSNALEYHMKKHTNSKNYKCRYCDFASIALGGLKRHERTHTGERPYQCKYCEKTFAGVAERQKHEHSHEGVYPYSFQYCDKQFIQTYNMKVHWMQHSGPYLCDVCKRSFAGAEILKFHYAHSHKIKNVIIEEEDEDIV